MQYTGPDPKIDDPERSVIKKNITVIAYVADD
jgi:hypothetical protein